MTQRRKAAPNEADPVALEEAFDELEMSEEEQSASIETDYYKIARPIGQAVKDYRELEWTIRGMIPQGSLIVLAGNPKYGKKSLICMAMCLAVARGTDFLGMNVKQGKTIFANFEDGYDRCVRRLVSFGVKPDATDPVDLVTDLTGYWPMVAYINRFKPRLAVYDPLLELELHLNCTDENRADELGKVLQQLRNTTRKSGTSIVMPHHMTKATKEMRGSSALKGSVDGWIYSMPQKDGSIELQWTNRDGQHAKMTINVEFAANRVSISVVNPVEFGNFPEATASGGGRKKKAEGTNADAKPELPASDDDTVAVRIRAALTASPAGLARSGLADALRAAGTAVSNDRLARVVETMTTEGEIEKANVRAPMKLTAKGREQAKKDQETERAIREVIGDLDDDTGSSDGAER
jgi:hypothetical protein